jgi:hypothetical protein
MNFFSKYKISKYSVYFGLFTIVVFLFALYIDNKYFYNFKKVCYSLNQDVELVSFDKIFKTIKTDNQLNSKLIVKNKLPFLQVNGFDNVLLSESNRVVLKRKAVHPTQQLALFSMAYATDYLIEKSNGLKLKTNDFELLNKVYFFVNSEILNFLSLNYATVNDHAISERVEFIILYLSYLTEFEPNETKIISKLQKDLKICISFLSDDNQFTWQTNHGIMQIRALALIANFTTDLNLKNQLLRIFETRLSLVLPYHLGIDGAVFESASGYWKYIYIQFKKISEIECVKNLSVNFLLKNRLLKSENFISSVTTNDGYLQGIGDSYSSINSTASYKKNTYPDRVFQFSNQLVGLNWSSNNVNSSLLFVSLDSPPNVHKLPEDLAIYIYSNSPFFSNTGIYAYGKSKIRSYFQQEASQSTIMPLKLQNAVLLKSFIVCSKKKILNEVEFVGKKIYQNSDTVVRVLKVYNDLTFQLIDSCSNNNDICSAFNLHPNSKFKLLNNNTILIINSSNIALKLISNQKISISKSIISDSYNKIKTVDRINLTGKKIYTSFYLSDNSIKNKRVNDFHFSINNNANNRYQASKKLIEKYTLNNKAFRNTNKVFIIGLLVSLSFFVVIIILVELYLKKIKKKHYVEN